MNQNILTVFTWKIEKLDCYAQKNGLEKVVKNIHWRCMAQAFDDQNQPIAIEDDIVIADFYGSNVIPFIESSEFISYNNLTQQIVLNWLWDNGINKTEIETLLENKIDSMLNPEIISPSLPW